MTQTGPSAPALRPLESVVPVGTAASTVVVGVVERGDQRGRELGFPTANLPLLDDDTQDGVWAATVQLDPVNGGPTYVAAVSVGRRPTYYRRDGERLLEAFLLDFSGDLYGRHVAVHLVGLLRGQRRFKGSAELVKQMQRDVERTRAWARGTGLGHLLEPVEPEAAPARPVHAVRGRRSGSGSVSRVKAERARRRIAQVAAAVAEIPPHELSHERVAGCTSIPVAYLRWAYPTADDLRSVAVERGA